MSRVVRTLIVDDSAVLRALLGRAIERDPQVKVVGSAMHGRAALACLQQTPVDVVLLDVEMPVMDGLTALREILMGYPHVRVVMVSSATQKGAQATIEALALGAAACVAKPMGADGAGNLDQLGHELLPLLKALLPTAQPVPDSAAEAPLTCRVSTRPPCEVVVIGSSTGGPNALSTVLSMLPESFACPILIAQHMPPVFTSLLAQRLERDGKRPCAEAQHGQSIEPGRTYIAPGNSHLLIERVGGRLRTALSSAPPEHFCRPSVNPLFRSAAEHYGSRTLGVLLTGMGEDGFEGAAQLVRRGGVLLAQDAATSVVWGMPGAVARGGLADCVLPVEKLADAILRYSGIPEPVA